MQCLSLICVEPLSDSILSNLWSNAAVVDSKLVNLILAYRGCVYVNDVVESDDDINPNSVICFDELSNTEPVNVSKFVSFAPVDDVKVFSYYITSTTSTIRTSI